MRILILNNTYPSSAVPNSGTYIKSIEECLKEANTNGETKHFTLMPSGLKKWNKLYDYLHFYVRLCFLPLSHYDLLYINHYIFMLPLFFRLPFFKGKIIFHWHGDEVVSTRLIIRFLRLCAKKSIPEQAVHISPSRYFCGPVSQWLHLPQERIFISPSGGVDMKLFYPSKRVALSGEFRIGFASGLLRSKGADILEMLLQNVDTLEEKIGMKIVVNYINYGAEATEWNKRFSRFPTHILKWEKMPKEQMVHFYQSIDFLLMPSVRAGESLGLVVLEAMACNLPVISRKLAAFPEFVIPGKTGELLELNDLPEDFFQKIVKVAKNRQNYHPREFIRKQYSKESVVAFYRRMIREFER